ncbi:LacI family DNA-binding transcriptional regulator [Paraburkholderia sp. EG287A]|uniref:Transcriptional regulator, LacI family n=2 Tax=Paraburkholderia TaxID=1822464 RepID=B2JXQ4_PARP8|nr:MULTISPECIES: LacI family DNA-binding transcriptional regulator [Paraburkholderia]ACC76412.1 transcriptional regulator, LacI family [Paraburkholderia phymatum STM815]PTB23668.1 LacI family transcriptional regulator [Paraburkholderia caribensis]
MPSSQRSKAKAVGNGKVRIEEVARMAEVSPATVSRVLNHPEIVRSALREKVQKAIEALAYKPDNAARALMSRKTRTVGIVVPTLRTSIFAEGIEALQTRLSERNYTLLIAASQYDSDRELQEVRTLTDRGVDGIVLVGNTHLPETYEAVRRSGIPFLTTYVSDSRDDVPAIGIDNESATYDMTRYLLGLGHREFGIIANTQTSSDRSRARVVGIRRALKDAGIALDTSRIIKANYSVMHGRAGLRELLLRDPTITAIICTTDTLAIGALAEAREMGLRVPQDLSITGFDDIELAAQLEPPLTTISMPAGEIGQAAADHLLNAIDGIPIPLSMALPYRLVVRASTAKPRTRQLPPMQR